MSRCARRILSSASRAYARQETRGSRDISDIISATQRDVYNIFKILHKQHVNPQLAFSNPRPCSTAIYTYAYYIDRIEDKKL